jgi:hypothetical protein
VGVRYLAGWIVFFAACLTSGITGVHESMAACLVTWALWWSVAIEALRRPVRWPRFARKWGWAMRPRPSGTDVDSDGVRYLFAAGILFLGAVIGSLGVVAIVDPDQFNAS